MCTCLQVPYESKASDTLGTGVAGVCESPGVGAEI